MAWPNVSAGTWWLVAGALAFFWLLATYRNEIRLGFQKWKIPAKDLHSFDMPIREAVDHYVRTFPHSYRDGADRHAFEVLHKAMCTGKLPVIGTKGERGMPKRLSLRQCRRLKPIRIFVPKNPASPQGVRFDLIDEAVVTDPLAETEEPIGYTGLRVRSSDLYRLWPKDLSGSY